jgi:TolA-binding protein
MLHYSATAKPRSSPIQLTPKLRFQEVDRSLDLREQLQVQTNRSRTRRDDLRAEIRKLISELDEKEANHCQELQTQKQIFARKFDEQVQAHAAERAAEIKRLDKEFQARTAERVAEVERLNKELQAQKAEMANLKASPP